MALHEIQRARQVLDAALRALPDGMQLLEAFVEEARRWYALELATERRHEAEARLAMREREMGDTDALRRRTAAERGLPTGRRELDHLTRALTDFERAADAHNRHLASRVEVNRRVVSAELVEASTGETARRADADHVEQRELLTREEAELSAIEASLGAAYRDVLTRIDHTVARAREAREGAEYAQRDAESARRDMSRLEGERPQLDARRESASESLSRSRARVDVLLQPAFALILGLAPTLDHASLALLCHDVSATPQQLRSVETRLQNRFEELQRDVGTRLRATLTVQDGLHLVEIDEESREPSAVYASRLARQLDEQRGLLADRERAVFEDQLLGTLCTSLYQRLRAAQAFAREADQELRRRPLASGVRFGIQWKVRQELAPHEAVLIEVLRRDAAHVGPAELEGVRRALRDALAHLRDEMPSADHRALLDRALDYRRWHRFAISLYRPDGQPAQELTKHRHAQLSGGEKAVALYAPLFAAARATFSGGFSSAPRVVALDEAFEGVDDIGRPELLAVTVAFDLDLVLTGYDLWLTDAAVPAAMHAQLHHDPSTSLSIAELVLWDGRALEDVDAAVAPIMIEQAL